jgi:flagellar FliL protein
MTEEGQPAADPPAAKGGVLALAGRIAGFFALALGAVLAGGFINAKLYAPQELIVGPDGQLTLKPEPKHEEKAAESKPANGPAIYYALDPPLVVNFEQDGGMRFLQVTVEVMARDQDVIAAVQQNAPLIRNNLMLMMSSISYPEIMTREGKEKLRAAALAEVKSILKRETGKNGPESLLFTSFVVQ